MLRGQMMERPLLITAILRHAAEVHVNRTVASRFAAEPAHKYTYAYMEIGRASCRERV